jgi:putative DNA primase/helicase
MSADIYTNALAAHDAGLCVLPPRQDGSKMPDAVSWTEYQHRLPTESELRAWYDSDRRSGLGFVTGRISGGLEVLDFDDRASAWDDFQTLVDDHGLGDLWDRVTGGYLERTPGGGYHVLFRSPDPSGSTKLAQRPKRPDEKQHEHDNWQALIETKGEGGYIVAAPTNGTVHPEGGSYEMLRGGVDSIATITAAKRDGLLGLARMLDQKPRPVYGPESGGGGGRRETDGDKPGDRYNAQTSWEDLLPAYGWRINHRRGVTSYWTRPGKDQGVSATTNHQGNDLLWVFTSSTELDPDRSYDRFGFYAAMEHNGDFRAAAGSLRDQGYSGLTAITSKPGSNGASAHSDAAGTHDHQTSGSFGSAAHHHETHENSWPAIAPLPEAKPTAPTMPEVLIPEPLRSWVRDIADLNKLPVEMVAAPAIVAAGAVVGREIGIRPGSFDDFTAVPNLWGALIARPGWMKTGAIKEAFRPLGRLAAAARDAYVATESDLDIMWERIEAEIDAIKRSMREAAKKGTDLSGHEGDLRAKRAELQAARATERRYLTHDATVEKLGELLRDNPRGMLVLRDELSGWLRALDKPGREGDREFFLEAWNGSGSFTVDRIGRGTIHIPALTLSLFGGIQPGKLAPLLASATEGGVGDDGLVQRLQVTVWPDRLPPWSKPTRWLDTTARDRAAQVFDALAMIDGATVGATNDEIPFLRFSSSAQSVADDWRDRLEHRLRSGELDDTPAYAAHIAKYRSLMPALALVFFLVDVAASSPGVATGTVGEAHARLAADWCGYLEAHACKLYAGELHAGASAAHALAAKIQAGALFDGQSVRELYRAQWAGLRTPERVLAGLTELTDLGWVRVESALTGGRPTQVVRLHPDLPESIDTTDTSGDSHDA